jgi:hypothetical protein
MSILLDGLNGITTPSETVQGALTTTGNTILGDATTDTLNVGAGGLVKDASGNVGIGTASPAFKLDVSSSAKIGGVYNDGLNIVVPGNKITYPADNTLAFSTNSTERMRIDSSGNLLVGTTSMLGSGKGICTYNPTSGVNSNVSVIGDTAGTAYHWTFNRGTNASPEVGSIRSSGSTASYVTTSDYRLKENVLPMTGALSAISQLKPVTYKWKLDGSDGQGFIAHELQVVVPDCVSGEKDAVNEDGTIKPQGIDTSFLVATLTAAIQEQQALITQLQADVATIKALSA